ncbi:ATP-dependent endonuclease [Vibrio splendidus]
MSKSPTPVATPLRNCGLPKTSGQFINRWLDVTKSNLLFAGGVILVEGIAEQMIIPALAEIVLKEQEKGRQNLEDLGISAINLNGIYFKHFMQLYCNINIENDDKKSPWNNIPIRCAGITDLDPPKKQTRQIPDPEDTNKIKEIEEDFIPYEGNMKDGTNHAIKLVDSINESTNARLYVSNYKTLEYDLAMEGNNAALMSEVIASLWPKPEKGTSKIIEHFTQLALIDWTKKPPEDVAVMAHNILKRIDDEKIGKGIFAQVLTEKIQREGRPFAVPRYIRDAILWASSIDVAEEC